MTKVCIKCGIDKPISEYHKSKAFTDGINSKCGLCVNTYNSIRNKKKTKEKKGDTNRHLSLFNPTQKDYCMMYKMLTNLGYDIKKNIHKQFVDRHSLEYQKKIDSWKNKYNLEDCDCETFLPKQNLS